MHTKKAMDSELDIIGKHVSLNSNKREKENNFDNCLKRTVNKNTFDI